MLNKIVKSEKPPIKFSTEKTEAVSSVLIIPLVLFKVRYVKQR